MSERYKARSVIWAVDPFEKDVKPLLSGVREMVEASRRCGFELLPVHVLMLSDEQREKGRIPEISEIQGSLERYLQRYSLGPNVQPRVIVEDSDSYDSAVRALLELADAEKAEWITVSSHGRSGIERFVLGSFAEQLLNHSPVPLLFLPRQAVAKSARGARVSLFPTDFSVPAHRAFSQFLTIAARLRLELVILHELALPISPMDIGLGPVLPERFPGELEAWAREEGALLVNEAKGYGVKARLALVNGLTAITGDEVLAAAKREKARMIAMPSLSGPWTRLMAGSVAQGVFRSGQILVWLYGPKALEVGQSKVA